MTSTPQFFRTLADRTRLRVVNLLARGPLCVCDIQFVLQQPQSSVSRHLGHLRMSGLVRDRRDGMRTFYELTDWGGPLARGVLETLRRHLRAEAEFGRDLETLSTLKASGECHQEGRAPSARAQRRTGRRGEASRPAVPAPARARIRGERAERAQR
jgi:ArsR family transcriptional regulator, arsenate/arsenite/antimonite-responsive transcriptional repressor